jgi:hypothetical protein
VVAREPLDCFSEIIGVRLCLFGPSRVGALSTPGRYPVLVALSSSVIQIDNVTELEDNVTDGTANVTLGILSILDRLLAHGADFLSASPYAQH